MSNASPRLDGLIFCFIGHLFIRYVVYLVVLGLINKFFPFIGCFMSKFQV